MLGLRSFSYVLMDFVMYIYPKCTLIANCIILVLASIVLLYSSYCPIVTFAYSYTVCIVQF